MLIDQLGNQPGQANVLSATRLRPPEMRVRALSKSYFGQSTITELIRHPSSRAPCPQPMIPPGVLPTQECPQRIAVLLRRHRLER